MSQNSNVHNGISVLAVLVSCTLLASCSALPNSGPSTSAVITPGTDIGAEPGAVARYDVILIDFEITAALEKYRSRGFSGSFGHTRVASINRLGVGDIVAVSIYESSAGGLFGTGDISTGAGSKSVQLPPQQIDQSGHILVPFAGRIQAAGRTTAQVAGSIRSALQSKAIDPQALVTLTQNASNLVTVSGEVGQGGRFPVSLKGDRILDSIAAAGGPRSAANDIYVRLTRGPNSAIMRLSALLAAPSENLPIQAGDEIFLYKKPDSFTVLGASGRNATVEFDQSNLSLIEALGKAGGLNDYRADATGVFLFRYENENIYNEIRHLPIPAGAGGRKVPVVYQLDLSNANSLLLGQRVTMRDKDVLYISNSSSTEVLKLFQLLGASVGIVGAGAGISSTLK